MRWLQHRHTQGDSFENIQEWVKNFAIILYILVCDVYITWLKQFKLWVVFIVIIVVGALTCALLRFVCYLKATQMNMQYSQIWKLMLYKFELSCNATEATKNICCVKSVDAVDHNTVNRTFKKFCWGCKNLEDQVGLKLWIPSHRGKSSK